MLTPSSIGYEALFNKQEINPTDFCSVQLKLQQRVLTDGVTKSWDPPPQLKQKFISPGTDFEIRSA